MNSSSTDNALDNCFSSKLRRLKIQEKVLSANLNKCFPIKAEGNEGNIKYDNDMLLKKYFCKLKDKFREVKHLFEDITMKTNDQYLEKSDIDELKKDILELETKIRTVKQFLASELLNLKNEEIALMDKHETSEPCYEERKVKRKRNGLLKGYKEIVPSPVRVMINSPFKCLEVQQFQDFMKNSLGRYGGWNEYSHNIFIQIWNKYYGDNIVMIAKESIEETFSYQDFKVEVLQKIPGSSMDSIDLHSKWYSEYLHLKLNQQKALNKWKENKRKIKLQRKVMPLEMDELARSPVKTKLCRIQNYGNVVDEILNNNRRNRTFSDNIFDEETTEFNMSYRNKKNSSPDDLNKKKSYSAENRSLGKKIDICRLLTPTKQCLLKQESEKETFESIKDVEMIAKLRIPTWRLNLYE